MLALPMPLVGALFLTYLGIALHLRGRRAGWLTALLFLCAAQGALISLVQYYGVTALKMAQPATAAAIPVVAWLAFQATAREGLVRWDGFHALVVAALVGVALLYPASFDAVIPMLFVTHGAAILWVLSKGEAAMPNARISAGSVPRRLWQVIGGVLLLSALSDVAIVAAQVLGHGALQPLIVSISATLVLFVIGLVTLSPAIVPSRAPSETSSAIPGGKTAEALSDPALMVQLADMLDETRLYLDPELSLALLARRLGVPAKTLSATINKETGANVSSYVNSYRIDAACALLRGGKGVTEAMYASGFNTKSNFNRAFKRQTGMAPTDWMRKKLP